MRSSVGPAKRGYRLKGSYRLACVRNQTKPNCHGSCIGALSLGACLLSVGRAYSAFAGHSTIETERNGEEDREVGVEHAEDRKGKGVSTRLFVVHHSFLPI